MAMVPIRHEWGFKELRFDQPGMGRPFVKGHRSAVE